MYFLYLSVLKPAYFKFSIFSTRSFIHITQYNILLCWQSDQLKIVYSYVCCSCLLSWWPCAFLSFLCSVFRTVFYTVGITRKSSRMLSFWFSQCRLRPLLIDFWGFQFDEFEIYLSILSVGDARIRLKIFVSPSCYFYAL